MYVYTCTCMYMYIYMIVDTYIHMNMYMYIVVTCTFWRCSNVKQYFREGCIVVKVYVFFQVNPKLVVNHFTMANLLAARVRRGE